MHLRLLSLLLLICVPTYAELVLSELPKDLNHWRTSGAQLKNSSGTSTVTFHAEKWSAAICTIPAPYQYRGEVQVTAVFRWISAKRTPADLRLIFFGSGNEVIPAENPASCRVSIPSNQPVVRVSLRTRVPGNVRFFRLDVASRGEGVLAIEKFSFALPSEDFSSLALQGVELPHFKVPGRIPKPAGENAAEVELFSHVPGWENTKFWSKRPVYSIPLRSGKEQASSGDHAASFRMAADFEYLYLYFQVRDDLLNFKAERGYERDCFEFFLMPSGKQRIPGIRQEQYTITRTAQGKTHTNAYGSQSRMIPGGWEAMLRIPLRKNEYRITPFTGLTLIFNAVYQDADNKPQEHYLSYSSADLNGESWRNPDLYVPLTFVSRTAVAYHPVWFGNKEKYDVSPRFRGRINLVKMPESLDDVGFWEIDPIAEVKFGNGICSVQYPDHLTRNVRLLSNAFTVLPGETLDVEVECRITGPCREPISFAYLAHNNWVLFGLRPTGKTPPRPGREWTRFHFSGSVPQQVRTNTRSGRLLMRFGDHPGATLEFRNLRLTRRLPRDLDLRLSVPRLYSHFRTGESCPVQLEVASPSDQNVQMEIKGESFFTGKTLFVRKENLALKKGENRFRYDLQNNLPLSGFFNLVAVLRAKGASLARRELYVAKYTPPRNPPPAFGIWIHSISSLTPPRDMKGLGEELRNLGNRELFFSTTPVLNYLGEENSYDTLDRLGILKKCGFRVGSIIRRGSPKTGKEAHELDSFFRISAERTRGLVDYWNFCNEPNLSWLPVPDGGEWALYLRSFAAMVRAGNPSAKVVLGSPNHFDMKFLGAAIRQGGNLFSDGVAGVHLYEVNPDEDGFEKLLAHRKEMNQSCPGWRVWDTESGMVYYTFPRLAELYPKKFILQYSGGIEKTLFYNDRDLLNPGTDASPLAAVGPAVIQFLTDARPIGREIFAEGKIHAYFFQRGNGSLAAAFWRVVPEKVAFQIPWKKASFSDQFGNRLERGSGNRLLLTDGFVHYAEPISPDEFRKSSRFLDAYPQLKSLPSPVRSNVIREICVVPEHATGVLNQHLLPGVPRECGLVYLNYSGKAVEITPYASSDGSVQVVFSEPSFTLAPHEHRKVTARLQIARRLSGPVELQLGGRTPEGTLVPMKLLVHSALPISITGNSRFLTVRNSTGENTDLSISLKSRYFRIEPSHLELKSLSPGEIRRTALQFSTRFPWMANATASYTIESTWKNKTSTVLASAFPVIPLPLKADPSPEGLELSAMNDGLRMNYGIFKVAGGIRIVARVFDSTPVLKGSRGDLKAGSDVFLAACRNRKGYWEYGIACTEKETRTYVWRGPGKTGNIVGMETAVEAPEIIRKASRNGSFYDLDIFLPVGKTGEGDLFSLCVIDRDEKGGERRIELGRGILPHAPEQMGVLLKH